MVQLTRPLELQLLSRRGILCLQSNPPLLLPSGFTVNRNPGPGELTRSNYQASFGAAVLQWNHALFGGTPSARARILSTVRVKACRRRLIAVGVTDNTRAAAEGTINNSEGGGRRPTRDTVHSSPGINVSVTLLPLLLLLLILILQPPT
ncbi:hypothetical protein E2C01_032058 [Portunus trituberculatus]|uniref:Uncharacterized protein n=1 Tax=Portunus trituberculatus TaxID=210409 RepID=A0A5B7EZW4_PORTR|nr:hypothetical protein [Portunus trituberculatus]